MRNPKYKPNKKNGGFPPKAIDDRLYFIEIPCGWCLQCKKKKAREWQIRLAEEIKRDGRARGVTFSFSDQSFRDLIYDAHTDDANTIAKLAIKRFRERWRAKNRQSIKHWFVTEIGGRGSERLHIHGIIWTNEPIKEIEKRWGYGNVKEGEKVTPRTTSYMTKYMTKGNLEEKEYKAIVLPSPGLGSGWLKSEDAKKCKYVKDGKTREYMVTTKGQKVGLPDYYRKKIYTERERELLQLEKMDRGTRFVNGVEMKEGTHEYYEAMRYRQMTNKQMGHGIDFKPNGKKRVINSENYLKLKKF